MIKQFILLIPVFVLMACGGASVKPAEPAPVAVAPVAPEAHPWDGKTPQEVCVDVAVSVCVKAAECGGDVDACAQALGQYCQQVTKVVDPSAVYNVCKPAVDALVCGHNVPATCNGLFE